MKAIIITMFSIALLATIGNAQEDASNKTLEKRTKTVARLQNIIESKPFLLGKVIKDKPYSAEAVSESIQTLEDGNRITRKTSVKMFRDSEGRTRREGSGVAGNLTSFSSGGNAPAFPFGISNTISIYDPIGKVRYRLNPKTKTARRFDNQNTFDTARIIIGNSTFPIRTESKKLSEASAEERIKMEKDFAKMEKDFSVMEKDFKKMEKDFANVVIMGNLATLTYKTTTSESLGTKMIEGVETEGTRTIKTIEAGAIGNELPIEITYEKWYSKDLDLIVYSRKYDPRSGEQIYKLINIDQTEPDSSLFTIPSDYKIVDTKPINLKK